jgi:hypothetical protein
MTARGVFFAITKEQAASLEAAEDDEELMDLVGEIEEEWDEENLAECDKAWDALHRLLTDGSLEFADDSKGADPLSYCVLGPNQLHEGDDYIVSLVEPSEVVRVADALAAIDKATFEHLYRTVVPNDYAPEYGDEDRDYTWGWFEAVRELYRKAAARDRYVLFTVDQ